MCGQHIGNIKINYYLYETSIWYSNACYVICVYYYASCRRHRTVGTGIVQQVSECICSAYMDGIAKPLLGVKVAQVHKETNMPL